MRNLMVGYVEIISWETFIMVSGKFHSGGPRRALACAAVV